MPFVYQQSRSGEPTFGPGLPSTPEEVRTEQFAEAFETSPTLGAIPRALNLLSDRLQGDRLDQKAATERITAAGLGGRLSVGPGGITDRALDTLIDRKRVEMRRQEVMANAPGGFWEGVQGLGIGLGVGMADPINVASGFLPIVSRGAYLARLAAQSSILGRTAIRAGAGAIEGAAGAALIEPVVAGSRAYEQADYSALDSLMNVALGSVMGAGLHTTLGAATEGVDRLRGSQPEWRGLGGLTGDEATLVLNFRDELRGGLDPKTAGLIIETWSPPAQRAIAQELTPGQIDALPATTRTALREAKAINEQVATVEALSPADQQQALRAALTQEMMGQPASLDVFMAGHTGRTADGVLTAELTPGIFRPEMKRHALPSLAAAVDRRLAAATAEPPSPRVIQAVDRLRQTRLAVAAMETGGSPADAVQAGLVREAAVMAALDEGVPVPARALAGLSPDLQRQASKVSAEAQARALRQRATEPGAADDVQAALDHAEEVLAREKELNPATESEDALALAREESQVATAELDAAQERLGIEDEDPMVAAINEQAAKAERWAKAAETAVACVLRGD